jgi:class 3 adenylate cyclase/tetratricopeptide (TPR) repeat protein
MRFCGTCGAQLATVLAQPQTNGADGAQRRHITVMFCDIVDSTPLAESLDPEDFRDVLTDYQGACARAIERFNGYAAQWQGDGVVAYFGYPRAHEDDAQRAVHASLQILDELVALNRRLCDLFDVTVQVRVGLHSGIVVAGEMGAGATREPLGIAGETPHIAARLQTLAGPGSVVLTDATRELLGEGFRTEPLGMKTLKGISRPIAVYRIAGPADGMPRREPLENRSYTPLIDRVSSLLQLTEAWRRASAGNGTIVHITGEAGIGKSRLVRALRERAGTEAAAVHTLRCSPHHASTALYPAIRFLEQLIGLSAAQSPEDQLGAIERSVVAAELDPLTAVPLLADLLSIPGAQSARSMPPRDVRNATLHILEAVLVRDAARHPLMFVLEDLHWADPTTMMLLERIVAHIESIPVASIFTFRGEFEPPWTPWQTVSKIEVGPLAPEDVRAMASAASSNALGADALRRVEAAADGVPLFVEEMVKALPSGAEREQPERGRGDSTVPATLQGLLAERLDRLPALAGVIDLAAVLGREFERDLLQALSPPEDPGFRSSLPELEAEDVLRPVEGSPSRLEFKHALLQEAAYDRLLRRRRRDLHERVAELLAERSAPAWESEPERIAYHWSCARQPAKALTYWELAGRRALKHAAFLEAAEHFRRSLEALDEARPGAEGDLQRGELLTQLGAALQAGRTPAAGVQEIYANARSAWERAGRRERLVPVIRGQFLFHLARARYADALPLAEEILAMGQQSARPVWLAEGHFDLGFVRMLRGELDRARPDFEAAIGCYREPDRSDQIYESHSDPGVGALAYLASMLWNQGHARQALEKSDRSLELAPRVGGPVVLAQAWGMRCGLLLVQGKWVELSRWLEKARTHCVERNIGYWSTVCSLWSAWLQGHAGEPHAGITVLQKHLDAYLGSAGRVGLPHFQALLADLYLLADDRQRALEALRVGQEHIETTGERYYEPELQWLMGRALIAKPARDPAGAAAAYERAAQAADRQDAKLLQLRALTALAKLQRRIGADCTALARVESLCRWFATDSEVPDVVAARALVSEAAMLG